METHNCKAMSSITLMLLFVLVTQCRASNGDTLTPQPNPYTPDQENIQFDSNRPAPQTHHHNLRAELPTTTREPFFDVSQGRGGKGENGGSSRESKIFGHRGMGCCGAGTIGTIAENSMMSIQAAVDSGIYGVEIDVWLTKDEEIIIIHGYGPEKSINYTSVLDSEHDQTKLVGIESLTLAELRSSGTRLKEPWLNVCLKEQRLGADPVATFCSLSADESNKEIERYLWSKDNVVIADDAAISGTDDIIPTLEEVLRRFYKKIQFNVEMKGYNVKIGLLILEVAAKYPGAIDVISSFKWPYSKLVDDKSVHRRGRPKVDLLMPIVNNDQNIPLGLLFRSRSQIPSIDRLIEHMNTYKTNRVHVVQDFWKTPGIFPVPESFSTEWKAAMEKGLVDKLPPGSLNTGGDVKQLFALSYLLHAHNSVLLTYWKCIGKTAPEDIHLHLLANTDLICTNDPKMATAAAGARSMLGGS